MLSELSHLKDYDALSDYISQSAGLLVNIFYLYRISFKAIVKEISCPKWHFLYV